jgi:hypothetical protein
MTIPQTFPMVRPSRWRSRNRGELVLLAGLAIATVATGWFINETIFTRDTFHHLLDARLDASRVDAQFDLLRQIQRWGYIGTPVFLAARLALVALTLQLFLLLTEDVPFRRVFHATAWAQLAVCAGGVARAVYLTMIPSSEISQATLAVIPGSVASVVFYPQDYQRPLYGLLSTVSLFELAWCVILVVALRHVARVRLRASVVATTGVWLLLATLQWGITWFAAAST